MRVKLRIASQTHQTKKLQAINKQITPLKGRSYSNISFEFSDERIHNVHLVLPAWLAKVKRTSSRLRIRLQKVNKMDHEILNLAASLKY